MAPRRSWQQCVNALAASSYLGIAAEHDVGAESIATGTRMLFAEHDGVTVDDLVALLVAQAPALVDEADAALALLRDELSTYLPMAS